MTSPPLRAKQNPSVAVVFVSNGPGELSTWVKPLAEKLHSKVLMQPRGLNAAVSLRLVLTPCPNATGQEEHAAKSWGQFEQITPAKHFWNCLINPKKYGYWPSQGLVVFLGGDQFWTVLLSARLGYRHITYAEWVARWPFWNDRIAAMSSKVLKKIPRKYRNRCTVVGDLMADLNNLAKKEEPLPTGTWVALMPGSKSAKLSVGVPFMIETADHLKELNPNCQFLLPVAPTTSIQAIKDFISTKNPIAGKYKSGIKLVRQATQDLPFQTLITISGTKIHLQETTPAHGLLSQCDLALTTVGANTAELGALGVPMIVIVPTQHISVMQAWDGLLGIIARLPGLRHCLGLLLSAWRLRNHGFLSWPNISAGRLVVPEKVGRITPEEIANEASQWLKAPERLQGQTNDLRSLRGQPGATRKMAEEIFKLLPKTITESN